MKILITEKQYIDVVLKENKIDYYRTKALDDLLVGNKPYNVGTFLIIPFEVFEHEYYDEDGVMMEHDSWDNRLFVNRNFFKYFFDTFGFESGLEARKYIADWFSKKFNLEVNYVG